MENFQNSKLNKLHAVLSTPSHLLKLERFIRGARESSERSGMAITLTKQFLRRSRVSLAS